MTDRVDVPISAVPQAVSSQRRPPRRSELRDPVQIQRANSIVGKTLKEIGITLAWLFLHTRITGNQVTFLAIVIGLIGAGFLAVPQVWTSAVGAFLVFSAISLDFADGTVARYRKSNSATGSYCDAVDHLIIAPLLYGALATRVFLQFGEVTPLFVGFLAAVFHLVELSVAWSYKIAIVHDSMRAMVRQVRTGQREHLDMLDLMKRVVDDKAGAKPGPKRFPLGWLDRTFRERGRAFVFGDHFQLCVVFACLIELFLWSFVSDRISVIYPVLVFAAALLPVLVIRTAAEYVLDREADRILRADWNPIQEMVAEAMVARKDSA